MLTGDGPIAPDTDAEVVAAATAGTTEKKKRTRKPKAAAIRKKADKKADKKSKDAKLRATRAKGEVDPESAKACSAFKKDDVVTYLGGAKVDSWLVVRTHLKVIGVIVNRGRSFVKTRVTGGKNEGKDTVLAPRFIEKV